MKKKLTWILALALVLTLLSGCGGAGGDGRLLPNAFYTRTASDEEAFSKSLEQQEVEEATMEDSSVPLSGAPAETEEGWLLVRYAKSEDGFAVPLWYRVWTTDGGWSLENLPCEGNRWPLPVVSGTDASALN